MQQTATSTPRMEDSDRQIGAADVPARDEQVGCHHARSPACSKPHVSGDQGSMRLIVVMGSMLRSKETMFSAPADSAEATRYASANEGEKDRCLLLAGLGGPRHNPKQRNMRGNLLQIHRSLEFGFRRNGAASPLRAGVPCCTAFSNRQKR